MAIRTKSILLCIIQAAISLMNQSPWHPSSWEPVITTRHVYTFTIHINKTCHIYQVWFRWCRVSLPSSWKTVIMTSCHNYPVLLQLKTMTAFIMTNCHHVKPSMTKRHHDKPSSWQTSWDTQYMSHLPVVPLLKGIKAVASQSVSAAPAASIPGS